MCRLKAIQKRALDGNDFVARHIELIPLETFGSSMSAADEEYFERVRCNFAKRAKILEDSGAG